MQQEKEFKEQIIIDDLTLDVKFSPSEDTVWLTQKQMSELFNKDVRTINEHIKNLYRSGELDEISTIRKNRIVQKEGKREVLREINLYNLDVIISVGYKVNSKRGVQFRRQVTKILHEYLIHGYVVNNSRLEILNRTIEVQDRIMNAIENDETKKILEVVHHYSRALSLLDDYDHQVILKPVGKKEIYRLTTEECRNLIDEMHFTKESDLFGKEKAPGTLDGTISAIYAGFGGEDIYPSVEEKAANLLYLITKNNFALDGNKRIAASIFLFFLDKNDILFKKGMKTLSDDTLVAITIMIAESRPKEKEIMIGLIMNFIA